MTDQLTPENEDEALAAEYALGLMTRAEAQACTARLSVDPSFRTIYARWATHFSGLFQNVAPVAPPARVLSAIQARLFPREKRRSLWSRIGLIPAVVGGVVALIVVLGIGNMDRFVPQGPQGPVYVATIAAEDADLVVLASFDVADNVLTLERTTGTVAEGRAQEVWVIPPGDGVAPVSLGLMSDAATTTISPPASLAPAISNGTLAISDEAPGGSVSGTPGAVLAAGAVSEA